MRNAFLIDYKWCSGCHSCELACQMLNDLPAGQFGVKVETVGPWERAPEKWQFDNTVFFTDQCHQCAKRVAAGDVPSCVKHCQAKCLHYGPLDEMVKLAGDKAHQVIQVM